MLVFFSLWDLQCCFMLEYLTVFSSKQSVVKVVHK